MPCPGRFVWTETTAQASSTPHVLGTWRVCGRRGGRFSGSGI